MQDIKIRYSQLDIRALSDWLGELYDLPAPVRCQFYKNGLNDIYKITSADGVYFFRVSLAAVHTTAEIEDEIAVILRCREQNLDVVEPIACRDERYMWEISAPEGVRQAVLFREVPNQPGSDAQAMYRSLGVLLAKIHEAALPLSGTLRREEIGRNILSDRPLSLLEPYLRSRKDDYDFMKRSNGRLLDFVEQTLPKEKPYFGVVHGDFQPGNYFFVGEKPAVYDFDCLGDGYLAYDLGVLLANLTFADNDIYRKPLWGWILDGYGDVRQLADGERKSVFAFAALQMMRVLGYHMEIVEQNSGVFYFTSQTHLDFFVGAYRRLYDVAKEECGLA